MRPYEKLTDEEVEKSMECCYGDNELTCEDCPMLKKSISWCKEEIAEKCIDLVKNLQDENKTLKGQKAELKELLYIERVYRKKAEEQRDDFQKRYLDESTEKYEYKRMLDTSVKETAKEILLWLVEHTYESDYIEKYFKERFGVGVEENG